MEKMDRHQRRYARLREQGLCVNCGQCPPATGIIKCVRCRDISRVHSKRAKQRKRETKEIDLIQAERKEREGSINTHEETINKIVSGWHSRESAP
jgi:hypothetical protein